MSEAYDKIYHFSGCKTKCGRMICAKCGKNIDSLTNDWLEAKKSDKEHDWKYVTWHRDCVEQQNGWLNIEKKIQAYRVRVDLIKDTLIKLNGGESDFAEEFITALGELGLIET